jgi:hypothetical protein
MSFNLNFKPFINYESIVTFIIPEKDTINAACMGVHFTTNQEVYIYAFEGSLTKQYLKPGMIFSINFSENFDDYVIAALHDKSLEDHALIFEKNLFKTLEPVPIFKSSWCSVLCEVAEIPKNALQRPLCRRRETTNIRGIIKSSEVYNLPQIFNNRSMNLGLEALIIATRIPLYDQYSQMYTENLKIYQNIKKKIEEWRDMDRFEKGFEMMDQYLLNKGVKAQDLFGGLF